MIIDIAAWIIDIHLWLRFVDPGHIFLFFESRVTTISRDMKDKDGGHPLNEKEM